MAMNVEHSTCVDLYKFADVFSVDTVLRRCVEWIDINFTKFSLREEFCSMSVNQLTEIISHDELEVKEETTVWEAVVRWVQHSREDRLHHLPSILPHIRFNLMTSGDTAAILKHPLVREDPGSSEVIRKVVQKGNPNPKPRLWMTTEMILMYNSNWNSKELFFMNPRKGKYISCLYKSEDLPRVDSMTVTSDNNVYILQSEYRKLTLFKYNHAENMWEQAGVSSSNGPEDQLYERNLHAVDGMLYYLAVNPEEVQPLLQMIKYNPHTNQWQDCSPLQLSETLYRSATVSCGSHLYFLRTEEMHCYDPSQDRWNEQTPPTTIPDVCTAVAMGTEIFCIDFDFTQTMMYDTVSDCWQELQGWTKPGNLCMKYSPSLFVMENQLHVLLEVYDTDRQSQGSSTDWTHLIYVYDRSADAWRDLKATLRDIKKYSAYGSCAPVARMYLPYLKTTENTLLLCHC
ncbi:kelch-like protein 6 [Branchiostoma floridae]|uniref:Kelch-like protein 6 n=1 Tax=Branchiostoma floridae TaxID=7739 RepID=A0A9J7LSR7_BRAFL|nr:kelch-like protein 6 [Branchiostoma floridae]